MDSQLLLMLVPYYERRPVAIYGVSRRKVQTPSPSPLRRFVNEMSKISYNIIAIFHQ